MRGLRGERRPGHRLLLKELTSSREQQSPERGHSTEIRFPSPHPTSGAGLGLTLLQEEGTSFLSALHPGTFLRP